MGQEVREADADRRLHLHLHPGAGLRRREQGHHPLCHLTGWKERTSWDTYIAWLELGGGLS